MSVWTILAIAVLTFGSRALALVVMPDPSPRLRTILDRIPTPLFLALGAMSLFNEGELADPRTLVATLGAAIMAPTRSLLLVLVGGLVGYVLSTLLG